MSLAWLKISLSLSVSADDFSINNILLTVNIGNIDHIDKIYPVISCYCRMNIIHVSQNLVRYYRYMPFKIFALIY